MITMNFPDTVTLYEVTYEDDYSKPTLDAGHTVRAAYEQTITKSHADFQDSVGADSVLYLDPNDSFVTGKAYRLEGLLAKINLFGGTDDDHYFEITSCFPVRDTLLTNTVTQVECGLKKSNNYSEVIS